MGTALTLPIHSLHFLSSNPSHLLPESKQMPFYLQPRENLKLLLICYSESYCISLILLDPLEGFSLAITE